MRGWPAQLSAGPVEVRPLKRGDAQEWREVRQRTLSWLTPWEATTPGWHVATQPSFGSMLRYLRREAAADRMLPFAVTYDERLVGQVTVGGILWGSLMGGHIGYWVDQAYAGRSIIPTAVALVTDHCFTEVGLHRLEINIRPENARSLRVVQKLGFRDEGLRQRYLHIDGAWRDHLSFALTAGEVPEGVLTRWQSHQPS
ncbi:MAG: GNAT family N-acetyltransferase [Actinomycetes bacterium]